MSTLVGGQHITDKRSIQRIIADSKTNQPKIWEELSSLCRAHGSDLTKLFTKIHKTGVYQQLAEQGLWLQWLTDVVGEGSRRIAANFTLRADGKGPSCLTHIGQSGPVVERGQEHSSGKGKYWIHKSPLYDVDNDLG